MKMKLLTPCIALLILHLPVAHAVKGSEFVVEESLANLPGIWKFEGFDNRIYDINSEGATVYQVSSAHCLVIEKNSMQELIQNIPHVLVNRNRQRWTFDPELRADQMHLYPVNKLSELPASCQYGVNDYTLDPVSIFNTFWSVFNENYAFFKERNVDWQQQYDANLWRVEQLGTSLDDQDTLFEILGSMIQKFEGDGHVTLLRVTSEDEEVSAFSRRELGERVEAEFSATFSSEQLQTLFENQLDFDDFDKFITHLIDQYFAQLSEEHYVNISAYMTDLPLKATADDSVRWGVLAGNIGYLEINTMSEFGVDEDEDEEGAELEIAALVTALDMAMTDLAGTKSMVMDLRLNDGGYEAAAHEIASRFFDRKRDVYFKETRDGDSVVNRQKLSVSPAKQVYVKPIYMLTSSETLSAAEYLVLIMKELPYVTHVGETTNGIFADNADRHLPNEKWFFTLSSEMISDVDGVSYEVIGVPSDHLAKMFDKTYRDNKQDSGLETVLKLVDDNKGAECEYITRYSWSSGFIAGVRITNTSSEVIDGWNVSWVYDDESLVYHDWNTDLNIDGDTYNAGNLNRNKKIRPGKSVSFGLMGSHNGSTAGATVVGDICN